MTIMVIGFILLHQTKHIIIIYKHIYICMYINDYYNMSNVSFVEYN